MELHEKLEDTARKLDKGIENVEWIIKSYRGYKVFSYIGFMILMIGIFISNFWEGADTLALFIFFILLITWVYKRKWWVKRWKKS